MDEGFLGVLFLFMSFALTPQWYLFANTCTSDFPEFANMASVTMTSCLLPTSSSALAKLPARRGLFVVKAVGDKPSMELKKVEVKEENSGRRELVFAAAAAAACSIAKIAMAEDEPKPGTPEAKKKYAPVCVTMPTARICRK